jgi:hypothetical protein
MNRTMSFPVPALKSSAGKDACAGFSASHPLALGLWILTSLLSLTGCQNGASAPPASAAVAGLPMATDPHVAYMDAQLPATVTNVGDRSVIRPDGRLHVEVDLKNLGGLRLQLQLQCVFKDEQGVPTGDETPWETLFLTENATETVPFDSLNPLARTYIIRIRDTR